MKPWIPFLLLFAIGCGSEVTTDTEIATSDVTDAFAAAGGKADRNSVQRVPGTNYYRIFDEAALELVTYALNTNADTFVQNGVNYVQADFAFCAFIETQAACVTLLDVLGPTDENELLRFGGPIAQQSVSSRKALALAIAMRDTLGIDTPLNDGFNPIEGEFVRCELRATPRPSFARCSILLEPTNVSDKATRTLVEASFEGLEYLGPEFVYEGWLIIDGSPVSGGRFDVTENTTNVTFEFDGDLTNAELYVLTIEPAFNDDPAPAPTHVLAGPFSGGDAQIVLSHPGALGSDFTASAGAFFLETPTSADDADFQNGIWFLNPQAGEASLVLPTLPAGWAYEGWVVGEDGPISTGRFLSANGPDSDAGGPAAGDQPAPPFPGQDFVNPPMNLVGTTVVISVEPEPDNSPAPFALKPLVTTAVDAARGELQTLNFNPQNISGTVSISTVERALDREMIVVANRIGGSISIIDAATGNFRKSIEMPGSGEPMYVAQNVDRGVMLVGDRANDRVIVMDNKTFEIETTIPTGDGPFHMFANENLLLVANDLDGTATLIDTNELQALGTFEVASDLIALGGKPHDAMIDANRMIGWISVLGVDNPGDWVVAIDLETGQEIGRTQVGGDPHLGFSELYDVLFILSQADGRVRLFNPDSLQEFASFDVPNAHGSWMSGDHFYTTNISDGGTGGIVAVDFEQSIAKTGDTPFATPHNVASTSDNTLVYVAHSGGMADKVTVYDVQGVELVQEITTGQNPFGIFLVTP